MKTCILKQQFHFHGMKCSAYLCTVNVRGCYLEKANTFRFCASLIIKSGAIPSKRTLPKGSITAWTKMPIFSRIEFDREQSLKVQRSMYASGSSFKGGEDAFSEKSTVSSFVPHCEAQPTVSKHRCGDFSCLRPPSPFTIRVSPILNQNRS